MQTQTTIHLSLTRLDKLRLWLALFDPTFLLAAAALPLVALLFAGAVWRAQHLTQTTAQPTALPAIMIIATARAEVYPTAVPPTPDTRVADELAALRQRVAELEARQAIAPPPAEVVYVQAPAPAPAPAAPPAEPSYQVDSAPVVPEQPQAAPAPAPVPTAAPATAATPSLEESLARTNASTAAHPNGSDQWREEHCVGDVCIP